MPVGTRIQLRRGDAAEWTSENPTLAAGEVGLELDTGMFKFGDGTTAWNDLAYVGAAPVNLAEFAGYGKQAPSPTGNEGQGIDFGGEGLSDTDLYTSLGFQTEFEAD